jgi:hypothetical protein
MRGHVQRGSHTRYPLCEVGGSQAYPPRLPIPTASLDSLVADQLTKGLSSFDNPAPAGREVRIDSVQADLVLSGVVSSHLRKNHGPSSPRRQRDVADFSRRV